MDRRQLIKTLGAAGATSVFSLASAPARAQFRGQQAKIVCGFPAGDAMDVVARAYAEKLKGVYAPVVIVENRPGAGGRIGVEAMKGAPADGSVMLFTPGPMVTVYPHVYKKLSYDPAKDLVPVSKIADIAYVLSVGPMVPASVTNIAQYVEWCKANPSLASYGLSAPGSPFHLMAESLSTITGAKLQAVPYRGGSLAVQDMVAGQVASTVTSPGPVAEFAKAGSVRIIGISSPKRWPGLENVQTFVEQGYPSLSFIDWFGVFLPQGASSQVAEQLNAAIRQATAAPEVASMFAMQRSVLGASPSAAAFAKQVQDDTLQWEKVVKSVNFQRMDS